MRCTVLASGSKGNCLLIEGSGGSLLVDAGLSAKETVRRLAAAGRNPDTIEAILVTHEHGDHISGVDVLSRHLNIPVCATEGTLRNFFSLNNRVTRSRTITCRYNEVLSIGNFTVKPFATSHDAAEPCGFILRENGTTLGICTDTGTINDGTMNSLLSCDGIVLESNHCPVMLKEGPYPEYLKRRIRSAKGHLSNSAMSECLCRLGRNTPQIILAHLSEVNNTPEKAIASARNGLGLLFDQTRVIVASQRGTSAEYPQVIYL